MAFYWIVEPAERILEAFEPLEGGGGIRVGAWGAGETARIRPFDAVELQLDRLFPTA